MDCSHDNIQNGVCMECGMDVGGTINGGYIEMSSDYSEYHSYIDATAIQPFEADLKNINIPAEVKNVVIKLASTCPRETHRMGVRRQQLFSYIYLAYLQLGVKFDPDKLMEEMKMSQREINMALRVVSNTSSVDIPLPTNGFDDNPLSAPVVVISPLVYLEDVCKKNNVMQYYEDIYRVSKNVLDKNKILLEFNPKHMAISLIRYYLLELNINISKFAKNNGISDSILKQHVARIGKSFETK